MSGRPEEHVLWMRNHLGEGMLDILREKAQQQVYKGWRRDLPLIAKHYREELAKMVELRADGKRGRIEFLSWN